MLNHKTLKKQENAWAESRRHYFTLIELLIVISILSIMASVVGFNVYRAFQDQRFRTEVGLIVDELRLAQDLMLILDTDVHVKFAPAETGIKYWIEVEHGVSKEWKPFLLRSHRDLRAIEILSFTEESVEGVIDIRFMSGGSVMSRGILRLASNMGKKAICLHGYPHPIVSVADEGEVCVEKDEQEFHRRLTDLTIFEIEEYEKV